MMTSSGDDNWPSGSLGLLTDKTKKNKNKNKNKPKAEQETAQPTAARFNNERKLSINNTGISSREGHAGRTPRGKDDEQS